MYDIKLEAKEHNEDWGGNTVDFVVEDGNLQIVDGLDLKTQAIKKSLLSNKTKIGYGVGLVDFIGRKDIESSTVLRFTLIRNFIFLEKIYGMSFFPKINYIRQETDTLEVSLDIDGNLTTISV